MTAVVTGASRGIGRAISLALVRHDASEPIALWARDLGALESLVVEIGKLGGTARAYAVDVTEQATIDRAAASVRRDLPPVRVVVNNAGAVARAATAELADAVWRHVLAVNLDGTFRVTRSFLPDLIAVSGRVINIASRAGREGTAFLAAYCAAKHGVVGFTRSLAEELRAAKVCVNAVCPGSVDTQMLREGLPGARPDMTPDDIARTVVFLAHQAPPALTGTCIDIFG